jgi:hypothetical protein
MLGEVQKIDLLPDGESKAELDFYESFAMAKNESS